MKKTTIIYLAAILAAFASCASAAQEKPNIVFILADDLGYGELGCYGATKVKTPNLDRLAAEDLCFTDAHTPNAVCTPTRYALLTGRYCWRTHLKRGVAQQDEALLIDPDRYTLPKLFKVNGYATACIGKWHLGFGEKGIEPNPAPDSERISWNGEIKPGPLETGFDYYFGVPINNGIAPFVYMENHRIVNLDPADPITKLRQKDMDGGKAALVRTEDLITDLGAKVVSFIEEHKNQPFFLYYALCHVHLPRHPSERFKGTSEAGYPGDFIQEMDWGVGEVLAAIERLGLKDNTIVIFTSDNGGLDIPAHNPNGPSVNRFGHKVCGDLRGQKTESYEGGHRVPFIIRWPGRIPAGKSSERLIGVHDMLPSFASLLSTKLPAGAAPDALDVLPVLLRGDAAPAIRAEMVMQSGFEGYAYREGDWVYLDHRGGAGGKFTKKKTGEITTGPPGQLYNLREDLSQQNNLYSTYPERVAQMKARLEEIRNQ